MYFIAASGRLLVGFRKWYYNMCGFNKIGKNTILSDLQMPLIHKEAYSSLFEHNV